MEQEGKVAGTVAQPVDALTDLFTYHPPTEEQKLAYQEIRDTALLLARTITAQCPPGPDRSAAIRLVREAVMTANASIATDNAAARLQAR